ncbi:MFS transporter [Lapillicoccus jejuensis]|uniref:MFS transporter n=1 Tax=Lapillicoccus jejuensis TaxID=402171 RepID=A0A542DVS4_9MICO|nr:MFS transporter [Lapillicoccus jejuensis]
MRPTPTSRTQTETVSDSPTDTRRAPGLLDRAHLPFVVATLGLVTLGAFENRATATVLPVAARELHGLTLFGAATAAPLASYLVATTVAGLWADRRGAVPPLRLGLVTFGLAQAATGFAPSMAVVAVGRLVSGVAEGMLDVSLTVLVAAALPERLRPRMFAAISTAWILPSVVGPGLAGAVATAAGWRWVFLLSLLLLGPAVLALRPSLRAARDLPGPLGAGGAAGPVVRGAVVAALALTALTALTPLAGRPGATPYAVVLLVLAAAVTLVAVHPTLPTGTFALAPGVPALVAQSALLAAAFGLAGTYIPLMLTTVRDVGPGLAGASLSVTGAFWSLGSWLQSLPAAQERTTPVQRVRLGFLLIAVGAVGPLLLAVTGVPLWAGLALWAVAGTGIGICSPTLATTTLALVPEDGRGRVTAARSIASAVGQGVVLGGAGALVAAHADDLGGGDFGLVAAVAVALAAVGALTAGRVRPPG